MNMDLDHVESLVTEKTKAIVPVHYGGLCNDMDRLNKIASKYNIPIIQDAAHKTITPLIKVNNFQSYLIMLCILQQ